MWSVRITVILYILVFFELGAVLIVSPWNAYWSDNFFLTYMANALDAPSLVIVMNSRVTRWAVTGLGVINILLGIWEALHFKQLVRLMVQSREKSTQETVAVSNNRPKSL
jgi:hypothetical protein